MKKLLVIGIIVLFVGVSVIQSTVGIVEKKTTFKEIKSPGYIQGLIDNASDGDTIHIPSGTYYENIIINKSISLIGEDKSTTIIDGSDSGNVVLISVDWVNISGFNIRNSSEGHGGIRIVSNYNTITGNTISNNRYGIYLSYSKNNTIQKNNFIDNKRDVVFYYSHKDILQNRNRWKQNYWNRLRILPKLIRGTIIYITNVPPYFIHIPWFNIDLRPALKPYGIEV